MKKFISKLIGLTLLTPALVFADTPPQVINKTCPANQFLNKIAPGAGNITCALPTNVGISALTGDGTATGPGSVAFTLATVNTQPGLYGDASHAVLFQVNGKGLITVSASTPIIIAESQVTNLVSDLAGKQATGNYVTSLTGEATGSGPGATAVTLTNASVIGKVLTGYTSGAGTVAATDTILQAIQKLNGNASAISAGAITSLTGNVVATGPGAAAATIQSGVIVNSMVSGSAAITYGKLALTNSILNADVNSSAGIVYSKLNLSNSILNSDVNSAAAIDGIKISPDFGSQNVATTGTLTAGGRTGLGGGALSTQYINRLGSSSAQSLVSTGIQGAVEGAINLNSSATGEGYGFAARLFSPNTAFTTGVAYDFYGDSFTKGAAHTLTRFATYGGTVNSSASTANVFLTDSLASVTGNYFMYSTSTNPSLLSGALQSAVGSSVGAAGGTDRIFRIGGSPSTSVSQYGLVSDWTATSTSTSSVIGVSSTVRTQAASFTAAYATPFDSGTPVVGSGSAISNFVNYIARPSTSGSNNALFSDTPTLGTGNFGLYISGTNPNSLAGTLRIASAPGTTALFSVGNSAAQALISGTTQYGASILGSVNSSATTRAASIAFDLTTDNTSFTLPHAIGLRFLGFNKGAANTITRTSTFLTGTASTIGATGNAVISDNESFTGNFFINSTSTNPSAFGGPVLAPIGSTANVSFGINGDPNTGLNSTGADLIDVVRGGQVALSFSSSSSAPYLVTTGKMEINQLLGVGSGGVSTIAAVNLAGGIPSQLTGDRNIGYSSTFTSSAAATHATLAVVGMYSSPTTNASAFTAPVRYSFYSDNTTKGVGSTITRDVGLFLQNPTEGSTGNASISNNVTFTGNYFINSTSTNPSAMGGGLTVGTGSHTAGIGLRYTSNSTGFLTGTGQIGILADGFFSSAATVDAHQVKSQVQTANAVFTLPLASSFYAATAAKGASNTLTRLINYYGDDQTAGSTGNAFLSNNSAFSGNFFFHQTGTRNSVLGGSLQFTTGATALVGSISNVGGALTLKNTTSGSTKIVASDDTVALTVDDTNAFVTSNRSFATTRQDVASAATMTALSSVKSFVKLTGATATTLQGIAAGIDGQIMRIVNLTGQIMTVANENASATAANRITTMTGADVVTIGNGAAEFIYDTGTSRWICTYVTP